MHDRASELRRIPLLSTPVNRYRAVVEVDRGVLSNQPW
jgi:hypothetical protein